VSRFAVPLAVFVLLAAVLAVGIKHSPDKGVIKSPLLGKSAPQFVLPNLMDSAAKVDARDLKGHWYVFNVWGTWCPECRAEHEALLEISKSGVVPIVGMDWKDEDSAAQQWLTQLGNPYSVIAADRDGRVAIDWGVYGAPETFLVDDRGVVVHKHVGAMSAEVWRRDFLPRLPGALAASGAAR
jgi:cytochrome c biogenesis protein CcmG/thiol:disulfide interchange protein DsbE